MVLLILGSITHGLKSAKDYYKHTMLNKTSSKYTSDLTREKSEKHDKWFCLPCSQIGKLTLLFFFILTSFCIVLIVRTCKSIDEQYPGYYSCIMQKLCSTNISEHVNLHYEERTESIADDKVISCYYNTPQSYQSSELLPSAINPYLCTHINIAFAKIVNKEIIIDENQIQCLKDVVKLKAINPKLKVLLSVGGAGQQNGFSDMVENHASRKVFIKSLKYTLRNYSLDGVDLDWEFPVIGYNKQYRGDAIHHPRERQHFSQLLHEIRAEYAREKRDYLLTIAAPAPEIIASVVYDIDQLNEYTHFVNIMTYDFHTFSRLTPFTGLNSPLFSHENTQHYLSTLNINYTVHMYMKYGLEPNKIVVGIPTYGHTFHLVNERNTKIGSPATGFGSLGGGGFVNYPDICRFIGENKAKVTIKKDNATRVPYLYKDYEWVSFDDPQSVIEKAKYIKEYELRGAMIYSLNADDYLGVCETGDTEKFPLSHSVKNTLIHKGNNV